MYNGIGLTTPRGSGTNGYVIRNLSTLRSHNKDVASDPWQLAPPKHREPDAAILDHERKRQVELKCLTLQLDLEDKGTSEDDIQQQVDVLRQDLLQKLSSLAPHPKSLKASDTHGQALAKKAELERMAAAFGTRRDYQEGDVFDREKQQRDKEARFSQRADAHRKREEDRVRIQAQKEKWEAEKRERDRLRRREEDRVRKEREHSAALRHKSYAAREEAPLRSTTRSRSPGRRVRRNASPPPARRRDPTRSPSPHRRHISSPDHSPIHRNASPSRSRHPTGRGSRSRSVSTGSSMSVSSRSDSGSRK